MSFHGIVSVVSIYFNTLYCLPSQIKQIIYIMFRSYGTLKINLQLKY